MLTRSAIRSTFFAALVLLALVASALLAGSARAAAPTELSAAATPGAVVYHRSAVIGGTISAPGAGPHAPGAAGRRRGLG